MPGTHAPTGRLDVLPQLTKIPGIPDGLSASIFGAQTLAQTPAMFHASAPRAPTIPAVRAGAMPGTGAHLPNPGFPGSGARPMSGGMHPSAMQGGGPTGPVPMSGQQQQHALMQQQMNSGVQPMQVQTTQPYGGGGLPQDSSQTASFHASQSASNYLSGAVMNPQSRSMSPANALLQQQLQLQQLQQQQQQMHQANHPR